MKIFKRKPEIIDFGISGKRADQINYSSYRDESEYKSVEYTVHYPDESAVFYGLRGKNKSYYFSSKQKGFFIEPASGRKICHFYFHLKRKIFLNLENTFNYKLNQ